MMNKEDREPPFDMGSISFLIPASREGEPEAREKLFSELRSYLESVADRNIDQGLKRKAGSSDIVQSSFMRILEKFDQFQGTTSVELKAWIKTIVVNEINGVRRSYKTDKRDKDREVSISPANSTSPGLHPVDRNLTPSSRALKAEQNKKFHEILGQLSRSDAEVIRLRNVEMLSFNEIGKRMNRSEQAASQLWYRAILKFEEKLRASGEFDG